MATGPLQRQPLKVSRFRDECQIGEVGRGCKRDCWWKQPFGDILGRATYCAAQRRQSVPDMAPTARHIGKVPPQFAHKVTKFHFKRMFCVTLCHLKERIILPNTPADRRQERVGDVYDKMTGEILHCKGGRYSGTFLYEVTLSLERWRQSVPE